MISTTVPTPLPEAQRLIAMSIGKIQTSRAQRGGPNLHKSLMVSAVLHKARTQIMMENFQAMLAARRQHMDTPVANNKPVQQGTTVTVTVEAGHGPHVMSANQMNNAPVQAMPSRESTPTCPADKENTPPPQAHSGFQESKVLSENKVNNTLSGKNMEVPETTDCGKCLKRRMTEDSGCETSSKRAKCDNDCENTENNNTHEPMECSQISSLVHRFNSGLSGLLTNGQMNNSNQGDSYNLAQSQTQGHCDNLVSSCATELSKEGLSDSISRSAIALSV